MESRTSTSRQVVYDGAVTRVDLDAWNSDLEELFTRMGPVFYRTESRRHAEQYLRGLLAPIQRKNGWTIAEYVGESEPKALQRFLNLSPWDVERLLELNRDYLLEHFASPSPIRPVSLRRASNRSGCNGNIPGRWAGSTIARSPHSWPTSPRTAIEYCWTADCTCRRTPGWPIRSAAPTPACPPTPRSRPGQSRSSR